MAETEADEPYEFNDDLHVSCQGKPRCPYASPIIQKAMVNSGQCLWCEKIWFDSDGNPQIVIQPGEA
jgi:hypothetical protein